MPPRITEKSCRPRVSDRTMVGNSATRLACEFQRTEGRRHDTNMKPQGGRSIAGPSLRGLWGRSATGHNGQAAKEEVSARWRGAGCRKNVSGVPAGRSVFHLTSLFIGPSYWTPGAEPRKVFSELQKSRLHSASLARHLESSPAIAQRILVSQCRERAGWVYTWCRFRG